MVYAIPHAIAQGCLEADDFLEEELLLKLCLRCLFKLKEMGVFDCKAFPLVSMTLTVAHKLRSPDPQSLQQIMIIQKYVVALNDKTHDNQEILNSFQRWSNSSPMVRRSLLCVSSFIQIVDP